MALAPAYGTASCSWRVLAAKAIVAWAGDCATPGLGASKFNRLFDRNNYIEVHTQSGRFLLRRTLNSFLEGLGDDAFCRVHRSVAVRRDAVRKLVPLGSGRYQLELIDGRNLISGRNYRDDVRTLLDASSLPE
jgi:hypothetical protein